MNSAIPWNICQLAEEEERIKKTVSAQLQQFCHCFTAAAAADDDADADAATDADDGCGGGGGGGGGGYNFMLLPIGSMNINMV